MKLLKSKMGNIRGVFKNIFMKDPDSSKDTSSSNDDHSTYGVSGDE